MDTAMERMYCIPTTWWSETLLLVCDLGWSITSFSNLCERFGFCPDEVLCRTSGVTWKWLSDYVLGLRYDSAKLSLTRQSTPIYSCDSPMLSMLDDSSAAIEGFRGNSYLVFAYPGVVRDKYVTATLHGAKLQPFKQCIHFLSHPV